MDMMYAEAEKILMEKLWEHRTEYIESIPNIYKQAILEAMEDYKSSRVKPEVMPNEVVAGGSCGTCEHWAKLIDNDDYNYGMCTVEIKYPISVYNHEKHCRRHETKSIDGNCPCYESQREA